MKTVEEIRRLNLLALRQRFSLSAMNAALGLNARDSTLSQICNQAQSSHASKPKTMGSDLALRLDHALGFALIKIISCQLLQLRS